MKFPDILKWQWAFLKARIRRGRAYRRWLREGEPIPPPAEVKRYLILETAKKYGLKTFVETGTYKGDTVAAALPYFDKIISIELEGTLASEAKERFKDWEHVQILQGDSGKRLPEVVKELNAPALYWLDGHFSGEGTAKGGRFTPVLEELTAIHNRGLPCFVMIDDARLFRGENDYLSLSIMLHFLQEFFPSAELRVEADIIWVKGNVGM